MGTNEWGKGRYVDGNLWPNNGNTNDRIICVFFPGIVTDSLTPQVEFFYSIDFVIE